MIAVVVVLAWNSTACAEETAKDPPATTPADADYQCADEIPAPGTLTAEDNCDGTLTATVRTVFCS